MKDPAALDKPVRVLVVDDSALTRHAFGQIVRSVGGFEVVGTAGNGHEAISRVVQLQPDVVILDLEMPVMDGFAFLRWMLHHHPIPVIVVSAQSETSSVFQAMDLGAVDFIAKPRGQGTADMVSMSRELSSRIAVLATAGMDKVRRRVELLSRSVRIRQSHQSVQTLRAVTIGASTGGPSAIQFILSELPADFPVPIIISQHMPAGFTRTFAERLNRTCPIRVQEVSGRETLSPGTAYIAAGGTHAHFGEAGGRIFVQTRHAGDGDSYVPSIDRMMEGAARLCGGKLMGILLTGMGGDGRKGMLEITGNGGYTIAESEETAVIFGMPQDAILAGAARQVLPLDRIPGEMVRICGVTPEAGSFGRQGHAG